MILKISIRKQERGKEWEHTKATSKRKVSTWLNLAQSTTDQVWSGVPRSHKHVEQAPSPWRAANPATSLLSCSPIIVISYFTGRLVVGPLQDHWAGLGSVVLEQEMVSVLAPGDKLLPLAGSWGCSLSSSDVRPPPLGTHAQKHKAKLSCSSLNSASQSHRMLWVGRNV